MQDTRRLTIAGKGGPQLAALYDTPAGDWPFPLVIMLHGTTGWKEADHLATLAAELARTDIAALRFDAPGSGESEGTWADDYLVSNYLAAVADVYEYARTHLPIDTNRVGIWGHSMGGMVADVCGRTPTWSFQSRLWLRTVARRNVDSEQGRN